MTNKEALSAVVGIDVADDAANKVLLDAAIDGAATYTADNSKAIDQCAIEVLQGILSSPDVSEGGYSIHFDRASVEKRLQYLCNKNNIANPLRPVVRGASPW